MGDISKNLSRSEMACRCGCGFNACDSELVRVIQSTCDHFARKLGLPKVSLTITSPNRCQKHNDSIAGSAPKSSHIAGIAADFRISQVHEDDVADFLESQYPSKYGIGRYKGRTHLDMRSDKAYRWDKR